MHLLPPMECGDRSVRLPLTDAAAAQLADAWVTSDEQQRRRSYASLLAEQPTLLLWVASRLEQPPQSWFDLVQWCDTGILVAWRDVNESLSKVPDATDQQRQQWSELAVAGLQNVADEHVINGWLSTAPDSPVETNEQRLRALSWAAHLASLERNAVVLSAAVQDRVRQEWLASSNSFSSMLYGMADKLRQLRRLEMRFSAAVEEEKLAALKEFAYGASHEINNPLANISTRAQTLLRDERDPERRRKLATINSQAFRAHEMISDLMLFAHPPVIEPQPLNLPSLIERLVSELSDTAEAQGTALVHRSPDHDLNVIADQTHLAVALKAICINALEALALGGRITLWSKRSEQLTLSADALGPWIEIGVHDSGPGISAETRRHIFDPYFSGREAGRGLGLGLSKCWRIVQLHGGHIEVASNESGTTFLIYLPMQRTPRRAMPLPCGVSAASPG